jgi:hypothetical protein
MPEMPDGPDMLQIPGFWRPPKKPKGTSRHYGAPLWKKGRTGNPWKIRAISRTSPRRSSRRVAIAWLQKVSKDWRAPKMSAPRRWDGTAVLGPQTPWGKARARANLLLSSRRRGIRLPRRTFYSVDQSQLGGSLMRRSLLPGLTERHVGERRAEG